MDRKCLQLERRYNDILIFGPCQQDYNRSNLNPNKTKWIPRTGSSGLQYHEVRRHSLQLRHPPRSAKRASASIGTTQSSSIDHRLEQLQFTGPKPSACSIECLTVEGVFGFSTLSLVAACMRDASGSSHSIVVPLETCSGVFGPSTHSLVARYTGMAPLTSGGFASEKC